MKTAIQTIPAGEFKAKCLQLMDEVQTKHRTFTITKRGVPVARLVPIENRELDLFGCMKGSVVIKTDIVSPLDIKWEANES